MLRRFSSRRIVAFFVVDCFGTLGVLSASAVLRTWLGHLPEPVIAFFRTLRIHGAWNWPVSRPSDLLPPQVFILVGLIWPFFFIVFSVYDGRRNENLKAELLNVFLAICASTMTLAGVLYFTYRYTSRVLFLSFFLLDVALLLLSRVTWYAYRRTDRGRAQAGHAPVLIVGAGPVGESVARQLWKHAWGRVDVVGFADDDPAKLGGEVAGLPVLGALDQISDLVRDYRVRHAVVALPLRAHERLVDVCKELEGLGVRVHVVPDLFALSFPGATLDGFGGIPVIDLGQRGGDGWQRVVKRTFDTVAVSVGLVIISPLLLLIGVLIKLDSPGPVLYKQERVGENGRPFTMLKFRSMCVDAGPALHRAYVTRLIEENLGLEQVDNNGRASLKMEDDPRVTRVGRIIRKTSLDELPQLLNVLSGEMSLVGPRPPIPYEVALYKDWHKRRLEVIPGITGLWQVKGRNRVTFDEMVRMDLEYIQHQSLWLDIKILLQTLLAIIGGRGAA